MSCFSKCFDRIITLILKLKKEKFLQEKNSSTVVRYESNYEKKQTIRRFNMWKSGVIFYLLLDLNRGLNKGKLLTGYSHLKGLLLLFLLL